MTNEPQEPSTVDQLLVTGYVQLLNNLMAAEDRAFRAQSTEPALQGAEAELEASLQEMRSWIGEIVDQLMIKRLVASLVGVPLLQLADADRILRNAFADEPLTPRVMAGMSATRVVVEVLIASRINFLSAISGDLYSAFWLFVRAVATEVVSGGRLPSRAAELPETRIAIYRACMTPPSWHAMTAKIAALESGLSPSALVGGVGSLIEDDAAAALQGLMTRSDESSALRRMHRTRLMRQYYTRLNYKIWPVSTQG